MGSAPQKSGWYVQHAHKGRPSGPHASEEIEAMLRNGLVNWNTPLSHDQYTKGEWTTPDRIPRFRKLLKEKSERSFTVAFNSILFTGIFFAWCFIASTTSNPDPMPAFIGFCGVVLIGLQMGIMHQLGWKD